MTSARAFVSIVLTFIAVQTVAAQSAHDVRRVELVFEGTWDPALVQDIHDDLASAHALLGVPSGSEGESLVRIVFARTSDVDCRITATNTLTERELARDVSLEGLTSDALGVVLAAAADELVAATWPEDFSFHAAPPRPPEPEPEPIAPEPQPVIVERGHAVGVLPTFDFYSSGQLHLGFDLRYAYMPIDSFGVALRAGFRRAFAEDTELGTVHTRAYSIALELFVRLLRTSPVRLDLFALLRGARIGFSSDSASAIPGTQFENGVSLRGGARLVLSPEALVRPVIEASLGGPLRGLVATDEGRVVELTGPYGLEVGLSAGIEIAW